MLALNFLRKSIFVAAFFALSLGVMAEKITDLPVKTLGGRAYYYYEVVPKDTPFALAKRFGISIDDMIKYNPAVKDGLKAYTTLYFPTDVFGTDKGTAPVAASAGDYDHVVIQRGQSLFSIAEKHGTTVDAILAANPGLDRNNYQAGREILVPNGSKEVSSTTPASTVPTPSAAPASEGGPVTLPQREPRPVAQVPAPTAPVNPEPEHVVVVEEIVENDPDTLSVVLMLPFETQVANPSKAAQLYTEFYKGFLMGLEEKSTTGMPVKVKVFDSAIPDDDFAALLNGTQMDGADLFIGPDKEQQLLQLAAIANLSEAYVLNPFVIKDEMLQGNPSLVQLNIPRNEMYDGAVEKFLELYPDFTTVILARVDGEADKVPFTDKLKERLEDAGRPVKNVVFRGVLTDEDIASLDPAKQYVFIPVSAKAQEFGKFQSGLREFKERASAAGGTVKLFGYPEWTTLRNDQLDQLEALEGTIYSRFVNNDNYMTNYLKSKYKEWYGTEWSDVEPNQALLGYDTAIFAIDNLRRGEGDIFPSAASPFYGRQSSFILSQPYSGAGYLNGALYIITYRQAGSVTSEVLSVPVTPKLAQ